MTGTGDRGIPVRATFYCHVSLNTPALRNELRDNYADRKLIEEQAMSRWIAFTMLLIFASGCASFRKKAEHLTPGMDRDQIIDVMGNPRKTETNGIEEALEYKDGVVLVRDGHLFYAHPNDNEPSYSYSVSSLSRSATFGKKFVLIPAMKGVSRDDLEFQEYAKLIAVMLETKGYEIVENERDADLAILVTYGISDPNTTYNSVPVWGQVSSGGVVQHRSTTQASAYSAYGSAYGSATTTGTSYIPPQYGVVGMQQVAVTTFTRYLMLEAVDYRHYLKDKQVRTFWNTKVASTGQSGDLRVVFPVLVVASSDYIDHDSKKAVTWTLFQTDPRLQHLSEAIEQLRLPASNNH